MCKTHELVFSFCWNLYFYNLSWKQHTWVKQSVSIRRSLCGLVYEVSNETSNNFVVFYFPSSFRSFVRQKCSFATSYVRWERPNDGLTFGRNIQFVTELNFADVFLEEFCLCRIAFIYFQLFKLFFHAFEIWMSLDSVFLYIFTGIEKSINSLQNLYIYIRILPHRYFVHFTSSLEVKINILKRSRWMKKGPYIYLVFENKICIYKSSK